MNQPSFQRRRRGFTLIELMVAMGITAIIVTVLVSVTAVATDTWTRSRSAVRSARQAKLMLDTMARDLESFVSRRGNDFEWFVAELDNEADLPKVAREADPPEVAWLTFFTAATDRYLGQIGPDYPSNNGDVSCVSYRLRYQNPIDGGGGSDRLSTFVLYRLLVNPDDTFQDLLGNDEGLESAFSSYKNEVTDEENFICENVVQLTMTFLVEVTLSEPGGDGTVAIARVPLGGTNGESGDFRVTGTGLRTTLSAEGSSVGNISQDDLEAGRLKGVELSISVISDAGLARLAGGNGLTDKDYARQVSHYTRVVELPGM